jgi:sugar phosphate isomerase/epimerase
MKKDGVSRREAIGLGAAALGAGALCARAAETAPAAPARGLRVGVSTYSMWQFRHEEYRAVERCIESAARHGFDGVEILQRQLGEVDNARLQAIKGLAFSLGLDLMGYSTHQSFLFPEREKRDENVRLTEGFIEEAYRLGIPTIRINTGRWGTSRSFDELMANRGIEPPLEGRTEEEAFGWVIEAIGKLLPKAQACGVVMGLENHWGLGLTPEGVLRIVDAIGSPWLKVTLDTGNFLEDPYDRLAKLAPRTVLLQAKTYVGGGRWYTLDLDYARIARIVRGAGYRGYVSLEFEGNAPVEEGLARSLEVLRVHFS